MKVEVKERGTEYPRLMKSDDGDIVLFSGDGSGVCLVGSDSSHYDEGDYSDAWSMGYFKPFNGKITLENK